MVHNYYGNKNICYRCNNYCDGHTGAVIDGEYRPLCHTGPDPTCYMKWQQEQSPNLMKLLGLDSYVSTDDTSTVEKAT